MSMFSTAEQAALDRVAVPVMRAGLAGDVVAAARSGAASRHALRRGWRRRGRVLLGAGALVVASATAAATGLLDKLPIRIPGITHVAEAPVAKPRHVVRAEKPHAIAGKPVKLATAMPLADPTPLSSPVPPEQWREHRAARIAAGLPVRRPLIQRAMAARLRALPPEQRPAARAEWRRIRALPPEERKLAVARIRSDFLAQHPKMAARYEQRLEPRSAAAADGSTPPAGRPTPDQRAERRRQWHDLRLQRGTPTSGGGGGRWRRDRPTDGALSSVL